MRLTKHDWDRMRWYVNYETNQIWDENKVYNIWWPESNLIRSMGNPQRRRLRHGINAIDQYRRSGKVTTLTVCLRWTKVTSMDLRSRLLGAMGYVTFMWRGHRQIKRGQWQDTWCIQRENWLRCFDWYKWQNMDIFVHKNYIWTVLVKLVTYWELINYKL